MPLEPDMARSAQCPLTDGMTDMSIACSTPCQRFQTWIREHTMRVLVQIFRRTVSIAFPVLCGYTIGTLGVLTFLTWLDSLQPGSSIDHLWDRYGFLGFSTYRYEDHPSVIITVSAVFVYTVFTAAMAQACPYSWTLVRHLQSNGMPRVRARRLWRCSLSSERGVWARAWVKPLILGFGAVLLSFFIDPWIEIIRTELDPVGVYSGMVQPVPTPQLGWLSYVDGIVLLIGIPILVYQRTIKRAACRIMHLPVIRRNWCPKCWYRMQHIRPNNDHSCDLPTSRCPECGSSLR